MKTDIKIDIVNNSQQTALHLAVQQGYFDITKNLIEKGATITAQDDEKNNILHLGASNGHLELLKYLLEKCPQHLIKEKNIFNKTPRDIAKDSTISKVLLEFQLVNNRKMSINTESRFERIQIYETSDAIDLSRKEIMRCNDNKYSHSVSKNSGININISTNIENLNNIINNIHTLPSNLNTSKKNKREKSPQIESTILNGCGSSKNLINLNVSKDGMIVNRELTNQSTLHTSKFESSLTKSSGTPNNKIQEVKSKEFLLNSLSSEPSLKYINSTTEKSSTKQIAGKACQKNKKINDKAEKVPVTQINLTAESKLNAQKSSTTMQINLSGKQCEMSDYENMSTKKFKIGGGNSSYKISTSSSNKAFSGVQNKKEFLTAKNTNKMLVYKEIDLCLEKSYATKKNHADKKVFDSSKEKSVKYTALGVRSALSPVKHHLSKNKLSIEKSSGDKDGLASPTVLSSIKLKKIMNHINNYESTNDVKRSESKANNFRTEDLKNFSNLNKGSSNLKSISPTKNSQVDRKAFFDDDDGEVLNKIPSSTTNDKNKSSAGFAINNCKSDKQNDSAASEEKVSPSSFVCHALIGKGSFGEVYLVEKISNNNLYAMKVLSKDKILEQNLVKYAMTERNVLSFINHPLIVKLKYAFQTIDRLFLILDYCPGGDLAEHLAFDKKFSESKAKFYLCQIILALEHLHERDIIFRDLKPDNVVLDLEGNSYLTDFGLSKEGVLDNIGAKSFCGSIAYLAPEMLKREGHGKSVDWYLLGVIFYEMLAGEPPYYSENK